MPRGGLGYRQPGVAETAAFFLAELGRIASGGEVYKYETKFRIADSSASRSAYGSRSP